MMPHLLRYGGAQIEYAIIENARLTARVRIHVEPDGRVEVEAPCGHAQADVARAVQKRARWIFRTVGAASAAKRHVLPRRYVSGEAHFYLGRRYKLVVLASGGNAPEIKLWRGRLEVRLPVGDPVAVRRRLESWYREKAKSYFARKLPELVSRFEGISSVPPFQLLTMEKQWGSCSPAGRLSLNPALIKAPPHCIEYVLLHEICHLIEHNHSSRFFSLLDRHCPSWPIWKSELDGLAEQLLAR